ncbi:substrate-binding domain-containing protein [Herbiconiux sp. YIM B11900]|uniref:substrate-binding domain-containing protein n=1 Tax=Herbiconiux sp. YIM B11900 TaxID=3404131 RepID=UPI003F85F032
MSLPVDGYIVAHPSTNDSVLQQLRRARVPVVTIDDFDDRDPDHDVRLDHSHGVTALLNELWKGPQEPTALITGTEDNRWNDDVRKTVISCYAARGEPLATGALYEGEGPEGARSMVQSLLDQGTRRFLVGPSRFAIGALHAARARGFAVPEDVEIAAFTDSPMAETSMPTITAMDVHLEDAGARAAAHLLDWLSGEPTLTPEPVRPEVKWRDSTLPRSERT